MKMIERIGLQLISWFCSYDYLEMIQGDLLELYEYRAEKKGRFVASVRFLIDCISSIFRFFSKGHSHYSNNTLAMLRINFITALRNIRKNKLTSSISILGLVLAIGTTLLIVQYVHYELSFDSYHPNVENLYRVDMDMISKDNVSGSAGTFYGLGEYTHEQFPEIAQYMTITHDLAPYGRLRYERNGKMQSGKVNLVNNADAKLFELFQFPVVDGSLSSALSGSRGTVITQELANRLFPDESAVGEIIYWDESPLEIKAVVEQPKNSHIAFELILPMDLYRQTSEAYQQMAWRWYGYYNYYQLRPGTDIKELEAKISDFAMQGRKSSTNAINVKLTPVLDIHLHSHRTYEPKANSSMEAIWMLMVIALLIVLIGYTNYVNLMTSSLMRRAKEIGIRKVIGSTKTALISQLTGESILINLAAGATALILVLSLSQYLPQFIQDYPEFYLVGQVKFWLILLGTLMVAGGLSGLYPALLLSGQDKLTVLKGAFVRSQKGAWINKALVLSQFGITSILLLFMIIVNRQLDYMLNKDLGANIDQTIVLKAPTLEEDEQAQRFMSFRNDLVKHSAIQEVSVASTVPGISGYGRTIQLIGSSDESFVISQINVDPYFFSVFDIQVMAGRGYSDEFTSDELSVVVNEKVAQLLDINPEDLINRNVSLSGDTVKVIGVIADYHHASLHEEVTPLSIRPLGLTRFIAVRFQGNEVNQLIETLQTEWESHFDSYLFDYFFTDASFQRQYKKEQELSAIVNALGLIAICIAGLGLFAISLSVLLQKRKEVSIRKVLGATLSNLLWHLSKDTITLVLISGIIATPIAYYFSNVWLDNFAYRIDIHPAYLLFPVVSVLILCVISIGYNIHQTAISNPTKSLRNE